MKRPVLKALLVVLLPIAVFLGTGYPMMHLTERDQFRRTDAPHTVPLNFRPGGYNAADATAYWEWLGPPGRAAERRFLLVDLAFPLGYGGAMLASLLIAWAALGRPFRRAWLVTPVVIAVVADWVENLIHLRQLRAFMQSALVDATWLQVASLATSVKTASFYVATFMILALAAWMVAQRGPRPLQP